MTRNSMRRRQFLSTLAATAAGLELAKTSLMVGEPHMRFPNPVGYATIAWPKNQLEHGLAEISKLGFKGVELVSWIKSKYTGSALTAFHDRLRKLKLDPVSLYTFPVRPFSTTPEQEANHMRQLALFFRGLGGSYLEVTDGLRPEQASDPKAVKALATRLNLLGKVAKEHGLGFGYHPHVGSLGQNWKGFSRVLNLTDPRYMGLIADMAHLQLGGSDPAKVILTFHDRLLYLHFKDARKGAAKVARRNPALLPKVRYWFCPIGKGVVDYPAIMKAIHKVGFKGWIVIELDRYKPNPGGPDAAARWNKKAVERLGLKV